MSLQHLQVPGNQCGNGRPLTMRAALGECQQKTGFSSTVLRGDKVMRGDGLAYSGIECEVSLLRGHMFGLLVPLGGSVILWA